MTDIIIRNVEAEDLRVFYRFVCALKEEQLIEIEFGQCYDACRQLPHNHYLVACLDDMVVGFISCHGQMVLHHGGYVYEIMELFVDAGHRSRNIGKRLLDAIEDILSKVECKLLVVAANMRRTDAHRFYLANGFQQTTYKFKKVINATKEQ